MSDPKVAQLHSRADSLAAKFVEGGGTDPIDEAIVFYREALDLCPPGHALRSVSLGRLTLHLWYRYNQLGQMTDLDDSIILGREGLELRSPGHSDRSVALNDLGLCLSARYNRLGVMTDLEEAIALVREALELCQPEHSHRSIYLGNLSGHLFTRYRQLGMMGDLDEAIVLCREALDLRPDGHSDRCISLNNLAHGLFTRYRQLGVMTDLNEAIVLGRDALALRSPRHYDRSAFLNNLANYLSIRYKQFGEMTDLDEVIALHREGLHLRPPGHPDRPTSLNGLACNLSTRYKRLGEIADSEDPIVLHREALHLRPPGHPDRSASLICLANDLSIRYKQLGQMTDLEEAIDAHREALQLRPPGHTDRSTSLNDLASDLLTRYKQLEEITDLEKAIKLHQESLHLRPPGHPDRSASLNDLASDLSTRYKQLGEIADLEKAIEHRRESLCLRPPGHPDRSASLNDLASDLSARYKQLGQMKDIDEASTLHQEALRLRPPGHQDRSTSLNDRASTFFTRYERLGEIRDLEEAISLHQEILGLFPPGHPRRSHSLCRITSSLCTRFKKLSEVDDREQMFSLYKEQEHILRFVLLDDLSTAKAWIDATEDLQHPTTLLAYETSLRLLIQHLITPPSFPQHITILKRLTSSLAVDAVSACLRNHAPTTALELLELGWGIYWSQLTQLRSSFHDVLVFRLAGKTLTDEFTRLTSLIHNALGSNHPAQRDRARDLITQLQQVITDIRHLPGLSRFLLPPLFLDLQLAASEGPVIVVNASKYSCDALVVLYDQDPVHIPLQITRARVRELSSELRVLTSQTTSANVTRDPTVILRELWDKVVSPIVDSLQRTHPSQSRIWWCPTAEFSFLPLHAAGPYSEGQQNLDDLYISSYTPTLTALARARRRYPSCPSKERKRIIAIGQATGESELVSVGAELASIARRVEDLTTFTRLEGPECCISQVSQELRKNQWVHIACHGILNPKQPFESAFALRDGHFTVRDIVECNLENPEFVYLSACHTSIADEEGPDEIVHIASVMHFAGFASVVGTMWPVDDAQTNKITSIFYEHMVDKSGRLDHTRAAFALHKTMKTLVDIPLDQRISYIHLGV